MTEKELVTILASRLDQRYDRILLHQNLASMPNFKRAVQDKLGYLPVLNEIDMVLVGPNGCLCAIEVKYYKVNGGSFNRPFYDGIGQSLSLMRYGFDSVALWHFFAPEVEQARLDRYGAGAWWFLRNQTRIPLDFSYFRVGGTEAEPIFIVLQYTTQDKGADLLPIDDDNFVITFKNQNPFRDTIEGRYLRKELAKAFGIQEIVSE